MRSLKSIFDEQDLTFYKFQIFVKDNDRTKTIGMAFLREGQTIYTLKIWSFLSEKFYLLPTKDDPKKFFLMTREPNRSGSKNKYLWNIIGNASANTSQTELVINFDVLDKKIYLSMYPTETFNPKSNSSLECEVAA
jgi:hypothetical protein